jgi:predicted ATP-grasp superfamily ATP-dependent carboligase
MSPDHQVLYELVREAQLRDPVLVVALEGWMDAGMGSAAAVASLVPASSATPLVVFDGDHFLDQRARRPVTTITNGVISGITWPDIRIEAGHDLDGADVLYLIGAEPDFHLRPFIAAVVELATAWGVRMVVALGAFPAPAPHTRPVRLAATVPPSSAGMLERIGVVQGELEVPTGIHGPLELAFDAVGVPAIALWARVPHYVAAMPFPEASAALIDGLSATLGLALDSTPLRAAADASRRTVDELIAGNPEHLAMVARLEQVVDAAEGNALNPSGELPTGEEIAAEFERYLRDEGR